MNLSWDFAAELGKWPWEVYEEMPFDWFQFGLARRKHMQKESERQQRQQSQRRPRTYG